MSANRCFFSRNIRGMFRQIFSKISEKKFKNFWEQATTLTIFPTSIVVQPWMRACECVWEAERERVRERERERVRERGLERESVCVCVFVWNAHVCLSACHRSLSLPRLPHPYTPGGAEACALASQNNVLGPLMLFAMLLFLCFPHTMFLVCGHWLLRHCWQRQQRKCWEEQEQGWAHKQHRHVRTPTWLIMSEFIDYKDRTM